MSAGPVANAPHGNPTAGAFARPLPFFYDLYTFRGTGGRTAVVAAFAVPAGRLEIEDRPRGVRYRFDVTLVLADTALRSVSRTDDSVYVGSPHPLPGEHLLFTHIEVQAPPSGSTLQRVIMTDATKPGIGQLYGASFPIPDYSGSDLMLSDIALGQPGAQAGWERGDVTLALLPTSQFPGSRFDVYYEIYNLPAGHRYATEIFVEDADSTSTEPVGDRTAVRLRFSGEAATRPDGMLPELRRVETALGRGHYRITVIITDEQTGETASRSRFFHVRGFGRGATMVTALPRGRQLGSRNR
ncbi:MAG: hypothetical protein ACREIV_06570 [Planctomycetaceae bacterium]